MPVRPVPSSSTAAPRTRPAERLDRGVIATLRQDRIVYEPLAASAPRFPMPEPLALRVPSDAEVVGEMEAARAQRNRDMRNLLRGDPVSRGHRPTMKDGSARVDYMFTRCVKSGARLVEELAFVGAREGFRVVVETDGLYRYGIAADARAFIDEVQLPACFADGGGPRGEILGRRLPKVCSSWVEDDGEISARGVSIPAVSLTNRDNNRGVCLDRERRGSAFPKMDRCGEVANEFRQFFKVRLALSMRPTLSVRENISHIEGGNMLPYRGRDGGVRLLIGKDSLAATIETIAVDADLRFDDQAEKFCALEELAKTAIAADYDLSSPRHVVAIEQGDYHLDTHVACNGRNVIIDAPDDAATVELGWDAFMATRPRHLGSASIRSALVYRDAMADWNADYDDISAYAKRLRKRSDSRKAKLAPLVRDLRDTKLGISFFGGRFYADAGKFNAISQENGTNPAGQRYVILANTFVDAIRDHVVDFYLRRAPVPYDVVYLLDAMAADNGAREGGGISCRCKARSAPNRELPSMQTFIAGTARR